MAQRHTFNQAEVLILEARIGKDHKDRMWDRFTAIANELGFKVRVTGGTFLTHDITCSEDDFNTILELTKGY